MKALKAPEQAALDAVAKRLSATWEEGDDSADAYLTIAGKRIAVDLATLRQHGTEDAKIRLRFDKVVIRLMDRLQAALGETVPSGTTVLLTVTAPIRLAAKTAALLEEKIQALLRRGSSGRDEEDTIHGNRIRIRLLRNGSARAPLPPKLLGFVHNPDSDSLLLLNMTAEWLELLHAESGRLASSKSAGERWLVVRSDGGAAHLAAHRAICAQLSMATDVTKILLVPGDGRVEVLAE